MPAQKVDVKTRLLRMSEKQPNGCWLWTGSISKRGYGRIQIAGENHYAHRVSFELLNGPVPPGLFVCHNCDVTQCVNPEHLFAGSPSDNSRDRDRKGRAGHQKPGWKPPSQKLTSDNVEHIRIIASLGIMTQKKIGQLFGVSHSNISMILSRKIHP